MTTKNIIQPEIHVITILGQKRRKRGNKEVKLTEICLLLLLRHPGGYHGGQAGDEGLAGLVCPARLPLLLPETKIGG